MQVHPLIYHAQVPVLQYTSIRLCLCLSSSNREALPRRLLVFLLIDPRNLLATTTRLKTMIDPNLRSVMSFLLHFMMMMMMMVMVITATATPVDTDTNSPTVNVHLPSSAPVLILMRSVWWLFLILLFMLRSWFTIDDNIRHMMVMILIHVLPSMYHVQVRPFFATI